MYVNDVHSTLKRDIPIVEKDNSEATIKIIHIRVDEYNYNFNNIFRYCF